MFTVHPHFEPFTNGIFDMLLKHSIAQVEYGGLRWDLSYKHVGSVWWSLDARHAKVLNASLSSAYVCFK